MSSDNFSRDPRLGSLIVGHQYWGTLKLTIIFWIIKQRFGSSHESEMEMWGRRSHKRKLLTQSRSLAENQHHFFCLCIPICPSIILRPYNRTRRLFYKFLDNTSYCRSNIISPRPSFRKDYMASHAKTFCSKLPSPTLTFTSISSSITL